MEQPYTLTLGERLEVEEALETAFAPLRERTTTLSPRRVRAAVRWGRGAPPAALPWSGAVARLSEVSVAVGMFVLIFSSAVTTTALPAATEPAAAPVEVVEAAPGYTTPRVSAPLSEGDYLRWLRLDRYVPLQDWLDPTVVRLGQPKRSDGLVPPLPQSSSREPF